MVTRTVQVCDVYGTTKGVSRYVVKFCEFDNNENEQAWTIDMSARAVKRLVSFIEKGTHKPTPKGGA